MALKRRSRLAALDLGCGFCSTISGMGFLLPMRGSCDALTFAGALLLATEWRVPALLPFLLSLRFLASAKISVLLKFFSVY